MNQKVAPPFTNPPSVERRNPPQNTPNLVGRKPPQAMDLERAVLGAIMLEKDALSRVIDILKPEIFYADAHREIFNAIFTLFQNSEPIDILTVAHQLRREGALDKVGGAYYLTELTNQVASAANIEYHTRVILEKYLQRELIRVSGDTQREAFEETTDVFDLLDKAEKDLYDLSGNNLRRETRSMEELTRSTIKLVEELHGRKESVTGVPSGFEILDNMTAGWQPSDLIIIAARPSMGKTAFVLSLARNAAIRYRKPVAFFSLEMTAQQLAMRLLSSEAEIDANKLRKGDLTPGEFQQLSLKTNEMSKAPIFIDDTPALSVYEMRAKCRRLKAEKGIELIVVDYLQLMQGERSRSGNREQEIAGISRSLKQLAKELNVPVIALSQLSRAAETRNANDKRPQLSDLRESGSIEQDADMVGFLYRPEYYKLYTDEEGNSTLGVCEVIIGKQRNGPVGTVKLRYVNQFTKFTELYEGGNDGGGSSYAPPPSASPVPSQPRILQSRMNEAEESGDFDVPF
jgi:replicative DNA helicase